MNAPPGKLAFSRSLCSGIDRDIIGTDSGAPVDRALNRYSVFENWSKALRFLPRPLDSKLAHWIFNVGEGSRRTDAGGQAINY